MSLSVNLRRALLTSFFQSVQYGNLLRRKNITDADIIETITREEV